VVFFALIKNYTVIIIFMDKMMLFFAIIPAFWENLPYWISNLVLSGKNKKIFVIIFVNL